MRKHFTREYVKEALFSLMEKKPFSKITITEVVERSGTSRASFYRNFLGLEDVIFAWSIDYLDAVMPVGPEIDNDVEGSIRKLLAAMEGAKRELRLIEQAGLSLHFQKAVSEVTRKAVDGVRILDNPFYSAFFSGAAAGFLTAWIQSGFVPDSEEAAKLYVDCLRSYNDGEIRKKKRGRHAGDHRPGRTAE